MEEEESLSEEEESESEEDIAPRLKPIFVQKYYCHNIYSINLHYFLDAIELHLLKRKKNKNDWSN